MKSWILQDSGMSFFSQVGHKHTLRGYGHALSARRMECMRFCQIMRYSPSKSDIFEVCRETQCFPDRDARAIAR